MTSGIPANGSYRLVPASPGRWSVGELGFAAALAAAILGGLIAFYVHVYSIHADLAGIVLTSRLAVTLGEAYPDYSLYFPPAEKVWFTLPVWLSDATGLRLDLAAILIAGVAVLFSAGLAYHIRRVTVGASPLFLMATVAMLVVLPILYKNLFGLREHMVVLGLWPYLVLRLSDPDNTRIGWKTRLLLGVWMGATLTLKYLYALVVLLVELVDAATRKRPMALFRIENLASGAIVGLYVFLWLVIDPSQREVIAAVVSSIDANLSTPMENMRDAAIQMALCGFFLLLAWVYKLPLRTTLLGLAMVGGAVVTAWIQSRWYTHHLFPITMAYIAWIWMIHRDVKLIWIIAVSLLLVRPVFGEFSSTPRYQKTVMELESAMDELDLSVEGKRVGILNVHPSPFNQYLAMHDGLRWNSSMNNSYVASELQYLDRPENKGIAPPPVKLDDPGRRMLHDEMLRLWEDMPPDVLVLDESRNWPLSYVEIRWRQVFSEDKRFQAILAKYRPVAHYDGKRVEFTYYVLKE